MSNWLLLILVLPSMLATPNFYTLDVELQAMLLHKF